jgi:DNA-binding transcriptional MerR regulator
VLRPQQVCAQLAVSASTLRAWSTEYRDYLSPAAQVGPSAGRAHRRYTTADIEVLKRIGELLHQGHRCEEVKQQLAPPDRGGEPVGPHASSQDADLARRLGRLEDALARARAHVGALEAQAVRYEHQLAAEQAAHAATRRALLEAQRQLAEAGHANRRLIEANLGLHAQVAQLEQELDAPVWQRVFR